MKKNNRAWLYPYGAERSYRAELRGLVDDMRKYVNAGLEKRELISGRPKIEKMIKNDDWSDEIAAFFLEALSYSIGIGESKIAKLPDRYVTISKFNDNEWRLQVKAGTGIELGPSAGPALPGTMNLGSTTNFASTRRVFGLGVDVYRAEPWLMPLQKNWVAQNAKLITSIPQQHMYKVEQVIRRGVTSGWGVKQIKDELKKVTDLTDRRASIIAIDQTAKANAALSEYRMRELGIESYVWMSSRDERVRPTHRYLNGKTIRWDKPPEITGGCHPGQEVLCRCWAKASFED